MFSDDGKTVELGVDSFSSAKDLLVNAGVASNTPAWSALVSPVEFEHETEATSSASSVMLSKGFVSKQTGVASCERSAEVERDRDLELCREPCRESDMAALNAHFALGGLDLFERRGPPWPSIMKPTETGSDILFTLTL